jgi:beta-lactam-binding protein with PASTA domain
MQAQVQMPNVVGQQYSDAFNTLENTDHLTVKQKSANNSAPANQVIAQDQPAGQTISEGSTVTLTVSTGMVVLPNVVGQQSSKAIPALNAAQWINVVVDPTPAITHEQSKNGEVATESPTAGNAYPQSTKITLKVYEYVPLAPSCPPSSPSGSGSSSASGAPSTGTSSSSSAPPSGASGSGCPSS